MNHKDFVKSGIHLQIGNKINFVTASEDKTLKFW
jgi:hypothetical protein